MTGAEARQDYTQVLIGGNGTGEQHDDEARSPLFRRWAAGELAGEADEPVRWVVRGLLVDPSYGMVAGEAKTLKSYVAMFVQVAVASGQKVFGRFEVDTPAPVLTYVGEGGRRPYSRRLGRVARAMGVDLGDLPLFGTHDVGPIGGDRFRMTLERDLEEVRPGLVGIDPLYAYHPRKANGASLYEEGGFLAELGATCLDAGASLLINHHFNQSGAGKGLRRLTMAGGEEWCDSWVLLSHREDADVAGGRFWLRMEIGSRQWGESTWDLDLNLGRFDVEAGEHLGEITWEIQRATKAVESDRDRVLRVVAEQPWALTRRHVAEAAGGHAQRVRKVVDELISDGDIGVMDGVSMDTLGRSRPVELCGPRSTPDHEADEEQPA